MRTRSGPAIKDKVLTVSIVNLGMLLTQQVKRNSAEHRLFTAAVRLQCCMKTAELISSFTRRLQSSLECSTGTGCKWSKGKSHTCSW